MTTESRLAFYNIGIWSIEKKKRKNTKKILVQQHIQAQVSPE